MGPDFVLGFHEEVRAGLIYVSNVQRVVQFFNHLQPEGSQ